MNFGITERGDAGLDLSWKDKLDQVDAAVIITKNAAAPGFKNALIDAHNAGHKIILHVTCTGMGATLLEPNVPPYKTQLAAMKEIVDAGFPAEQIVLRIDPIFPDTRYMIYPSNVAKEALVLVPDLKRIRISVMDLHYRHLQQRFIQHHIPLPNMFKSETYIGEDIRQAIIDIFRSYFVQGISIETCAEPLLATASGIFQTNGCVSNKDLAVLGLPEIETNRIGSQRPGVCMCLPKKELLTRRAQCPHRCLYCFWR